MEYDQVREACTAIHKWSPTTVHTLFEHYEILLCGKVEDVCLLRGHRRRHSDNLPCQSDVRGPSIDSARQILLSLPSRLPSICTFQARRQCQTLEKDQSERCYPVLELLTTTQPDACTLSFVPVFRIRTQQYECQPISFFCWPRTARWNENIWQRRFGGEGFI